MWKNLQSWWNGESSPQKAPSKARRPRSPSQTSASSAHAAQRRRLLQLQRLREDEAIHQGLFVLHQRVLYIKDGEVVEARIVGVHQDDEMKPYFTIAIPPDREKQTTPERLQAVPWDEDETWKILDPQRR